MKPSTVKCDGCGEEVHDDLAEIAGDEVLCARCREKIPRQARRGDRDAPAALT